MARERLVKAVNRLGVVGRNGRSRKVTAVIRFYLDFKATPNEKSHNC